MSQLQNDNPKQKLQNEILVYVQEHHEIHQLGMAQHPNVHEIRRVAQGIFNTYLEEHKIILSRVEREQLFTTVMSEFIGWSLLEPLLADETISEIRVLGAKNISVVRNGKREKTELQFDNADHLLRIIDRMIAPLGKRFGEAMPIMSFRLPDGSHVSVTDAVIANNGPIVNIFKHTHKRINQNDLIQLGTIPAPIMSVLHACVQTGCNIFVTGLAQSGKTALLNVLGNFIPDGAFVVTIETSEEFQLIQEAIACLHAHPHIENKEAITLQHLLQHAQTMRPDRIMVGEVTGVEVYDLLTIGVGWLTSCRASDPEDALIKLESLYLIGDEKRPIKAVRSRIANSIDLIVHLERMRFGEHKVTRICEVHYDNDEGLIIHDLFRYEDAPNNEGLHPSGMLSLSNRPSDKLLQRMIALPVTTDVVAQVEALFGDMR